MGSIRLEVWVWVGLGLGAMGRVGGMSIGRIGIGDMDWVSIQVRSLGRVGGGVQITEYQ